MDYFIIKKIKKKIISFLFDLINLSLEEKNIEIIQIDEYNIELEQSLLLNSPIIKKNSLKNKFDTNEESIEDSFNGCKFGENESKITIIF